jgi:hypothetical protein
VHGAGYFQVRSHRSVQMGHNDHIDSELHDAIQDLVAGSLLEEGTPAYGIAQQVIAQGWDSLSDKQRCVYQKHVEPLLQKRGEELRIQEIIYSNPD